MAQEKSISEELKIAIINYLSGRWNDCDSSLLKVWLEENDENSQLFGQLVDLWEADKIFRKEKEFDIDKAWNKLESQIDSRKSIIKDLSAFKKGLQYAAILIFVLFLGGVVSTHFSNQANTQFKAENLIEYSVPYGSKTNLKLPDGTLIRLNAGTTIKYNQGYGIRNRDVLLSGEAFFQVFKNKKLPFIVNAKNISIQALGTKFNVKAYSDEKTVETTLLEGSVKLKNSQNKMFQNIVLEPNQKALFDPNDDHFIVSAITNNSDISWASDKWVVKNTKLDALAKLLMRRYNVIVKFDDDRIKNYEFGGTIKNETIEQVLSALTYSSPIKYKIINNEVTLFIDESKVNQYNKILNKK